MYVSLEIVNLYAPTGSDSTDYFGQQFSDDEIWLFFLNTNGKITYTHAKTGGSKTVADATALKLSEVKNKTFSLDTVEDSTKLFAGFGKTNPFTEADGPGTFESGVPYALIEWTLNGNSYDNVDVTYIDSFSFPTTLVVKDAGGQETDRASFAKGSTAKSVVDALKTKIASTPNGPSGKNYPQKGAVGYGPPVPTLGSKSPAARWIGSSKFWISGPASGTRDVYLYAPSFKEYLQYLQTHEPTTKTNGGSIKGWYIDYSGDGGYSGYLSIHGDENSGFGLHCHDIRVNTNPSAADGWKAKPEAGTAVTGEITVAANGSTLIFPPDGSKVSGAWTDAVIYSGAAVIGTIGGGPVIEATGDLAPGGAHETITATFLASISASMATGLLGSHEYRKAYHNQSDRKATMYWFNTLSRGEATTKLFDHAWPDGEAYYDPYWSTLAEQTDNQGYLSPFNDRWANFSPGFHLASGYQMIWELGIRKK